MDLGKGLGFWNTMPIRRRTSMATTSGSYSDRPSNWSRPSIRVPGMRSFMRLRQRRKVVLPHPDGPIRAVIS